MWTPNQKMDVSFQLWLCFVSIRNFEVCVLRVSFNESFQKISGKVTLDQVDHCWSLGFHAISTMHFIDFHLHAKLQTQVHDFFEARTDSCFLRSHDQKPRRRLARTEPLVGSKDCEAVYASHFFLSNCSMWRRVKDLFHHSSSVLLEPCLPHWIILGWVSFQELLQLPQGGWHKLFLLSPLNSFCGWYNMPLKMMHHPQQIHRKWWSFVDVFVMLAINISKKDPGKTYFINPKNSQKIIGGAQRLYKTNTNPNNVPTTCLGVKITGPVTFSPRKNNTNGAGWCFINFFIPN